MSFRSDIHAAVDAYVPSAPWLAATISDSIAASRGGRRPSARRRSLHVLAGLRGAGVLAALMIAVLLVVAVLIGGRVWRDFGAFNSHGVPAGSIDPVAQLRARPLQLPPVPNPAACPEGPDSTLTYQSATQPVLGSGPVYWTGVSQGVTTHWGTYYNVVMFTKVGLSGPVLVRGIEYGTNRPLVFTGSYAAGPVVGTDIVGGKTVDQHSELVVDTSHPPSTTAENGTLIVWNITQGAAPGDSGCFGFQFDGPGFSEVGVGTGPQL